jgi:hypothetical protein
MSNATSRALDTADTEWAEMSFHARGAETEEPAVAPAKPDIHTKPNVVPRTDPVPEPDHPCEHPGTSCPIRE